MRLRISPVTCSPFDLMRQLSKMTLSQLQISDTRPNWSMKWLSNFVAPAHLPFYARGRRRIEPPREATLPRTIRKLFMTARLPHTFRLLRFRFSECGSRRRPTKYLARLSAPLRNNAIFGNDIGECDCYFPTAIDSPLRAGRDCCVQPDEPPRVVQESCFGSQPTVCGRFLLQPPSPKDHRPWPTRRPIPKP